MHGTTIKKEWQVFVKVPIGRKKKMSNSGMCVCVYIYIHIKMEKSVDVPRNMFFNNKSLCTGML
jgi:hypothetical protein